jgi:hypothetical protein
MDIDIIFENKQIEFFSKVLLCTELIKNDKIKKVRLASSKIFLNKILNNFDEEKKKIKTIIYKDIWSNSEIFIILSNLLKFQYCAIQEEDYIIFHSQLIKKTNKQFLKEKSFNRLNFMFTLSQFTKDYYEKLFKNSKNIYVTGNPRYDFLKLVKKKGHYKNSSKTKKTLLSLNGPIFSLWRLKNKKTFQNPDKLTSKDIYTGYTMADKNLDYNYTKKLLRIFLEIVKLNPKHNFILRPYPLDRLYLKYYERLFRKMENIEISVKEDILYCLDKSDKVISAPDNVALEAVLFKIPVTVFYDSSKFDHKYHFADHPFIKYFSEYSFINSDELNKFLSSNKILLNNETLEKYYGFENNSLNSISNRLTENIKNKSKDRFLKSLFSNFFSFLLSKIVKKINHDIIKKNFNTISFLKFRNTYKYSFTRFFFYFYLRNFSIRGTFIEVLYKYCVGKNYDEHDEKHHLDFFEKIDILEVKKFLDYYELIKDRSIKVYLDEKEQVLIFEK